MTTIGATDRLLAAAKKVLRLRRPVDDDWDICPLCKSMQWWHIEIDGYGMCPLQELYEVVADLEPFVSKPGAGA